MDHGCVYSCVILRLWAFFLQQLRWKWNSWRVHWHSKYSILLPRYAFKGRDRDAGGVTEMLIITLPPLTMMGKPVQRRSRPPTASLIPSMPVTNSRRAPSCSSTSKTVTWLLRSSTANRRRSSPGWSRADDSPPPFFFHIQSGLWMNEENPRSDDGNFADRAERQTSIFHVFSWCDHASHTTTEACLAFLTISQVFELLSSSRSGTQSINESYVVLRFFVRRPAGFSSDYRGHAHLSQFTQGSGDKPSKKSMVVLWTSLASGP
jgi:hypothetical protein